MLNTRISVALLCFATGMFSCGKYNFLGGGKSLAIEKLPFFLIPDDPQKPGNKTKFHNLFDLAPGTIVEKSSYTGGIVALL